jgi:hypothetical protein
MKLGHDGRSAGTPAAGFLSRRSRRRARTPALICTGRKCGRLAAWLSPASRSARLCRGSEVQLAPTPRRLTLQLPLTQFGAQTAPAVHHLFHFARADAVYIRRFRPSPPRVALHVLRFKQGSEA